MIAPTVASEVYDWLARGAVDSTDERFELGVGGERKIFSRGGSGHSN